MSIPHVKDNTIYFVETTTAEQKKLLCQWAEYFYESGLRVQVVVDSTMTAQLLDQLLWTFSQPSFIPHRIIGSRSAGTPPEPVIIVVGAFHLEGFEAAIFDGDLDLDLAKHFKKIIHFVFLDDLERKQKSRLHWQAAKEIGFAVKHLPQSANLPGSGR